VSKIIVCGDTHAYWSILNNLIAKEHPDIILQTGDFGYWEGIPVYSIKHIDAQNTKIYFCPGNHEDWNLLNKIENPQLTPNIKYMKKGTTMILPDGRNVLFIGGADSVDKQFRTPGYDWFPEELINETDIKNLPDEKVDIVISHTCPDEFEMRSTFGNGKKFDDPSRHYLSLVLKKYKPKNWYFSHWHQYKASQYKNGKYKCDWICLNESQQKDWWIEIE
jgi:hypothetical protein